MAITNAILPAGITDLTTQEALAGEFLMLLADRDASILTHPALFHATATSNSSNVVRVPHLGIAGYDLLSATTPGSEITPTALTDGSTDVTLATRAIRYAVDDFAQYMADGKLDVPTFAQSLAIGVAQTLISLLANVGDDFTAVSGSTGVDAAWSDILTAKAQLGVAKATGPMMAILHPQQWADLETDALSQGVLPAQTMGGAINQGLDSYKGNWMGVDIFTSSHVPTANAGADRAGCVVTRGGLVWADAQLASPGDPNILDLGRARFERVRQGEFLLTSYVLSFVAGVAQGIDAAGVSVITDA